MDVQKLKMGKEEPPLGHNLPFNLNRSHNVYAFNFSVPKTWKKTKKNIDISFGFGL